jgi:hypothetical protein
VNQGYTVTAMALSADGATLATAGEEDKKARLWDVAGGEELFEFAGHDGDVEDLVFAPRGQTLLTASRDGTIRLWERISGKQRRVLNGHLGEVNGLALSRDGSVLASRSRDGTVLVWEISGAAGEPIKLDRDELDKLWTALGSEDAVEADDALRSLVRAAEQAVPLLKEHLKPVSKEISQRIKKLIAELDSEDFEVREKASTELASIGSLAAAPLREALKKASSLEFKVRAEKLLAKMEVPGMSHEQLRLLRAIEVLEWIGDKTARDHLKLLGDGMPQSPITKEAKAALARLDAIKDDGP